MSRSLLLLALLGPASVAQDAPSAPALPDDVPRYHPHTFTDVVLDGSSAVIPPPDLLDAFSVVDVGDVIVVRPSVESMAFGFDQSTLDLVVARALQAREHDYDFVMVTHTWRLPHTFDAGAFHRTYNNGELQGIGQARRSTPGMNTRSVLWMNHVDYWHPYGQDVHAWVFSHELSHYWLAHGMLPERERRNDLLGRQTAHWSYFMHTPNSPIEGNAWIDHGDGSFTTDLDVEPRFSSLDLYLMGLDGPDKVEPFFYIDDPQGADRHKASGPEHLYQDVREIEPVTVEGTRVDVTIDEIVAALGQRSPRVGQAPTHFDLLTVLVLNPSEDLEPATLDRVDELQTAWEAGWSHYTGERSTISFEVREDWGPPPMQAPALVPRGAW